MAKYLLSIFSWLVIRYFSPFTLKFDGFLKLKWNQKSLPTIGSEWNDLIKWDIAVRANRWVSLDWIEVRKLLWRLSYIFIDNLNIFFLVLYHDLMISMDIFNAFSFLRLISSFYIFLIRGFRILRNIFFSFPPHFLNFFNSSYPLELFKGLMSVGLYHSWPNLFESIKVQLTDKADHFSMPKIKGQDFFLKISGIFDLNSCFLAIPAYHLFETLFLW